MVVRLSPDLFRHALDHIPDAVLISDPSGAVQFANRQLPQLLGYAVEEILGQDIERLVPERFRWGHVGQRQRAETAGWQRAMGSGRPLAALRKDGSELPVQISLGFIEDASGAFSVATIRELAAYRQLSQSFPAHDPATPADPVTQEATDGLAATRRINAARWISASYLLRQQLQALSILTGLLARQERLDDATLKRALSGQSEAIVTTMNLLEFLVDQSNLESPTGAEITESPEETVTDLIERIKRDAALRPVTPTVAPLEDLQPTVLVVLREWNTREAAAGLLRSSGYQVLTAKNVHEAWNVAGLHPEVSFMLTEQVLGDSQTGREAIRALHMRLGAKLKSILISDEPLVARTRNLDPSEPAWIARMPLQAEELLHILDELREDDAGWSGKDS